MSNTGLPADFLNQILGLDDTFRFRCTQCGKCCKWFLTDDGTGQHVRVMSAPLGVFSLIDTCRFVGDQCAVVHATVVIHEADLTDQGFIARYLKPYGYSSYQNLLDEYGGAAKQIAAECFFETELFSLGDILHRGTLSECLAYISDYVQKEGVE